MNNNKVLCVNADYLISVKGLTKGKIYSVISKREDGMIGIKNDLLEQEWYSCSRFEDVKNECVESMNSFFFDQDGVVWHYNTQDNTTTCSLGVRFEVDGDSIHFIEEDDGILDTFKLYPYNLFDKIF